MITPATLERLKQEAREAAEQPDRRMTNGQVGALLGLTLAQAYRMARKGDVFSTIDPVEFASMTAEEQRYHRRMLKRTAREARRK